ncbi:MAG TPA: hypothetical protein VGJ94_01720 [Syntrophorhabdaceae bacterium]|jgi:signal recognition particle subunit SEC65
MDPRVDPEKWVRIHTIESVFEMDMIRDALDKEGIEYSIKEYKDTAYDGLFILQKGYASLSVERKNEEIAKKVVTRIRSLPYVAFSKD